VCQEWCNDISVCSICPYDHVNVYDGNSDAATILGSFCGSQIPDAITSTGSEMYVVFISDISFSFLGFSAFYAEVL
jgi:hypothetical protein